MSEHVELYQMTVARNQRVAGVIVLYRPEPSVYKNIEAALKQVDVLFLVDNSEAPIAELVEKFNAYPHAVYHAFYANKGIAKALNYAANAAIGAGCDYLLTLDQDSLVFDGMVEALIAADSQSDDCSGIFAPAELVGVTVERQAPTSLTKVPAVWTSGNLLKLNAYKATGPFREDLFIDFVDYEYCFRLNKAGFGVYLVPGARMAHSYGVDARRLCFLGYCLWVSNHSPIRRYYIMRNRLLVHKLYGTDFPRFVWKDRLLMLCEFVSILIFEKQKLQKINMTWQGWCDFRRKKFGPYFFHG